MVGGGGVFVHYIGILAYKQNIMEREIEFVCMLLDFLEDIVLAKRKRSTIGNLFEGKNDLSVGCGGSCSWGLVHLPLLSFSCLNIAGTNNNNMLSMIPQIEFEENKI